MYLLSVTIVAYASPKIPYGSQHTPKAEQTFKIKRVIYICLGIDFDDELDEVDDTHKDLWALLDKDTNFMLAVKETNELIVIRMKIDTCTITTSYQNKWTAPRIIPRLQNTVMKIMAFLRVSTVLYLYGKTM